MSMTDSQNLTGFFFHSSYTNRLAQLQKIRDCNAGNEKVKDQGAVYLPKPSGLSDAQYKAYKNRALFYPVVPRTVSTLIGASFKTDPKTKLPKSLEKRREQLTPDGITANAAIKQFVKEMLLMGRGAVMVDLPKDSGTEPPFMALYKSEEITNWKREYVGGKRQLTRVVIRESSDMNSGGEDEVRFLELLLVPENGDFVYTVTEHFAKIMGKGSTDSPTSSGQGLVVSSSRVGETFTPNMNGRTLNEIPFFIGNAETNGPEVETSPMLHLCDVNLSHYHNSGDYEHILYMLASPTFYVIGKLKKNQLPKVIGSSTLMHIDADPNEVEIGILEYTGTGSQDLREAMKDKEGQMAALGAHLIHRQDQPETAEAVRIKAGDSVSILDTVIINTEDVFNDAWRVMDKWANNNNGKSKAKTQLNRDFIGRELDVALYNAIRDALGQHQVSAEVAHDNYKDLGIMPEERTLEEEQKAIEEDRKKAEENKPAPPPNPFGGLDPNAPNLPKAGDEDLDEDEKKKLALEASGKK